MVTSRHKLRTCLLLLFLLLPVAGCGLNVHRMHPEFDARTDSVKNAVLVTPDVNMYEISGSGVAVLRDDWSSIGRKNLQIAIARNFAQKQCSIKLMATDAQTAKEMTEIRTLYKLVHQTMDRNVFGHRERTVETNGFDYSVGSLETVLKKLEADSMIFVTGYDQVTKEGRKAMIDLAVADSSGTILYYSVKGTTRGKDLRDPGSTDALVRDLLSDFSRMQG